MRKIKCEICDKDIELKFENRSVIVNSSGDISIYTCQCGQQYKEKAPKVIPITKKMILQE